MVNKKQSGGRKKGRRQRRLRRPQFGGGGVKKAKVGVTRGVLKAAIPDYGPVTSPFPIRYAKPSTLGPAGGRASAIQPLQFQTSQQMQTPYPSSESAVNVVIKGRPVALYSKGRRIVPRVR